MIVYFNGKEPQRKYLDVGVVDNHRSDELVLRIDKMQGSIDLSGYKPWIKISTKDLSYVDKLDQFSVVEGKKVIDLIYHPSATISRLRNVDMQVSFEKVVQHDDQPPETLVWQTIIFCARFADTINFNEIIEERYPVYLQELESRLTVVEDRTGDAVEEHDTPADFPESGIKGRLYIDKSSDELYRYDTDSGKYECVSISKVKHIFGGNA